MSDSWRLKHKEVISSFLEFLNNKTDQYILKGGTALMMCYGLNRFSEDIDLDGQRKDIIPIIEEFCKRNGFSCNVKKNTDTVKRCMINYGNENHKLKVETSFRRRDFSDVEIIKINGIMVYSINELCIQKAGAYAQRDKIRDLFDLSFITNNYYDELNSFVRSSLRNALEFKGLEQFDFIVKDQPDELIDIDVLADNFLVAFDKLGILSEEHDQEIVQEYVSKSKPPLSDIICSCQARSEKLQVERKNELIKKNQSKDIEPKR